MKPTEGVSNERMATSAADLKNWTWGEDGASIFATVEGVDRLIAGLPRPHWLEREAAKELRKEIARLIAAAPRMLDALELAEFSLSHRDNDDPTLSTIRTAIAIATGNP